GFALWFSGGKWRDNSNNEKRKKDQDATFFLVNISQTWGQLPRLPGVTIGRLEREMRLLANQKNYRAYLDPDTKMYRYPTSLKEVYDVQREFDGNWIPRPGTSSGNGGWQQDSLNDFYNNATNFFPHVLRNGENHKC
ncbi:MAG: hypothetical protein V8R91_05660, partial [Butyricimonas faecihominis]